MVCINICKLLCIARLEQARAEIQHEKERAHHLEGMFIRNCTVHEICKYDRLDENLQFTQACMHIKF